MLRFVIIVLFSPLVSGFFLESLGLSPPKTVTTLDLNKYLGGWYQMYASESVYATFEQDAQCVTANYSLPKDGSGNVTVLNAETVGKPTGPLKLIHGYAEPTEIVGQLIVHLETVPIPAPYWVLKLGPETFGPDKKYQYAVVSDFFKATLFVLARDTTGFKQFEPEVLTFLKEQGFTSFINKPVKTYHGSDCVYTKDN